CSEAPSCSSPTGPRGRRTDPPRRLAGLRGLPLREIGSKDAAHHALVFHARIGDQQIEGCDFLHIDGHGSIDELMVMVRPLTATLTLAEAMKAQLAPAASSVRT
ncbi:MAG: hypothetical protein ACRDVO_12770, partial [Jiangellaceae bacterium]